MVKRSLARSSRSESWSEMVAYSTGKNGAELARAAGVPQLVMFHHDPGRTDAQVAELEAKARQALPGTVAAREGLVLVASDAERMAAA